MQVRNLVRRLLLLLSHRNRTSKMYASKGSFEVKLRTRGTDGQAEMGGVREEQRRSKKIREEKGSEERKKDDAGLRSVAF